MNAEEIVTAYADMVYKIAYRYAQNRTDADDIFSETFLTYFKKDRSFESEEHRKAWLIRVTINCAKTMLGSRQPTEELLEERVGAAADMLDEHLALHEAIAKLTPALRETVELFYLKGLSVREVAQTLGKTESNVRAMLTRARESLRRYLEE